jgi:pantothenate kinase
VLKDGFHYTQQALSAFEDADEAFRRRGAPFTFDADAFVQLVHDLKSTPVTTSIETEVVIAAPSFDHKLKDPVEGGIAISSRNRVIIVEGNYTLLNQSPWSKVAGSYTEKYVLTEPLNDIS